MNEKIDLNIEWENGMKFVSVLTPLKKTKTQKENNKIELYKKDGDERSLLVTFYEIWDFKGPKYSLKAIAEEGVSKEFIKHYDNSLLPLCTVLPYADPLRLIIKRKGSL